MPTLCKNQQEFFQLDNVRQRETVLADFEFSETDIEHACAELSYSSASGPDGIPSKLLKVCKKELKKPLFILWRSSLNQGIIPPDLLLVLISPIHKGGSRVDPSRYRPVALTSHLIKVFERVIRKTLVKHENCSFKNFQVFIGAPHLTFFNTFTLYSR